MGAVAIGIDLGGTKTEIIALDGEGKELVRRRVTSPRGHYETTIETIASLIAEVERELGAAASIGIGHPGAISPSSGLLKNANSTWLNGRPLDRDLERRLDRPVTLANDADCLALSEATDGAAAGAALTFAVIVGTGTGGGIAFEARLLPAVNAIRGEWGHNPLPWPQPDELPGRPCYCGLSGCIETWLSGPGLAADHHATQRRERPETIGDQPDALAIAATAREGDAASQATVERWCQRLARALAAVINLLDPDVIVLGGGLSNIDIAYQRVPQLWRDWVFSDHVATELRRAEHGDSSGVRGAAWLGRAAGGP